MKFHVQQVLNNYADKDMKPFASTIESLVNSEWFHRHAFALRHRGKQDEKMIECENTLIITGAAVVAHQKCSRTS